MKVKVLVFAHIKEIVGSGEITLELENGCKGDDVLGKLTELHPQLADHRKYLKLSMNGEYISNEEQVLDNSEIAIFPPVSGG